jgi:hypothetical protein
MIAKERSRKGTRMREIQQGAFPRERLGWTRGIHGTSAQRQPATEAGYVARSVTATHDAATERRGYSEETAVADRAVEEDLRVGTPAATTGGRKPSAGLMGR